MPPATMHSNSNAHFRNIFSSVIHGQTQLPSFGRGSSKKEQRYLTDPNGPPIPLRSDGRRKRVHPTREQQTLLEAFFQANYKPSSKERAEICKQVNINSRSVQIWFQNRRAKMKKDGEIPNGRGADKSDSSDDEDDDEQESVSPSSEYKLPVPTTPSSAIESNSKQQQQQQQQQLFHQQPPLPDSQQSVALQTLWTTEQGSSRILASELNIGFDTAVVEAGYTFKMELPLSSIIDVSIHPFLNSTSMSSIALDVGGVPSFYRELRDPQGGVTGLFAPCDDFTESKQASVCTRHVLHGSTIEMERLFLLVSEYFDVLKRHQDQQFLAIQMQAYQQQQPYQTQPAYQPVQMLVAHSSGNSNPFPISPLNTPQLPSSSNSSRDPQAGLGFHILRPTRGQGQTSVQSGVYQWGGSDIALLGNASATGSTSNSNQLVVLPAIGGGLVIAFNIPGLETLKLSRKVLPRLFDGTIKQWNDALLVADNPSLRTVSHPIMVVRRSPGSGSTVNLVQGLKSMDASLQYLDSPFVRTTSSQDLPITLTNNSILVNTNGAAGVIVGNYPYTITYMSQFEFLQEQNVTSSNCHLAKVQHQNGEFIDYSLDSVAIAVNTVDQQKLNQLNVRNQSISVLDSAAPGSYPFTVISNIVLNLKNVSIDYDTTVWTAKFLWWYFMNPSYTQSESYMAVFNTSIGDKALSYLKGIEYRGEKLYGQSICDQTFENWKSVNPCLHGYCLDPLPFQDPRTECICNLGYENVLFKDCREPMQLFPGNNYWPGVVKFVLCGVGTLVTIYLAVRVFLNHDEKHMKAVSPFCNYFILAGSFVGQISILALAASVSNETCSLIVVLPAFSFAAIFGMILLKSLRIFVIFQYRRMARSRMLQDTSLLVIAGVFALVNGGFAFATAKAVGLQPVLAQYNNRVDHQYICAAAIDSLLSTIVFSLFLSLNALLMVACLVFCYLTRDTVKRFNESKSIALVVYVSVLIIVLCSAIVFGLSSESVETHNLRYLSISVAIFLVSVLSPLILLAEPLQKGSQAVQNNLIQQQQQQQQTAQSGHYQKTREAISGAYLSEIAEYNSGRVSAHVFQVGFKRKRRFDLWVPATLMVIGSIHSLFIMTTSFHMFVQLGSVKMKLAEEIQGEVRQTNTTSTTMGTALEMQIGGDCYFMEFDTREKMEEFLTFHTQATVSFALEHRDPDGGFVIGGFK
ncbi:hypothetical protein BDR26DRAFT_1004354 [Obelidium mucronatum]|nr:hypothetical protein BDR26DRAFT_1004354 [Obelidium mucronatum]